MTSPTPALLDYIKSQLDQGVEQNKIKADLIATGWSETDCQQAFLALTDSSLPSTTNKLANNSPSNHLKVMRVVILALIIIVVMLGIGVSAYVFGFNPFVKAPYTENNFVSGLLKSFSEMKSATLKVSGSLQVVAREDSIKPFEIKVNNDAEIKSKFMRDHNRANQVSNILSQLESYSGATFPADLKSISRSSFQKIDINDPLSKQPYDYQVINGGKDFALKVNFETSQAIPVIKKLAQMASQSVDSKQSGTTTGVVISGQEVTFSKNSSTYLYLTSRPPLSFFESLDQSLQAIPADFNAIFSLLVTSGSGNSGAKSDWQINVDSAGDIGDLSYKANIDAVKKDNIYYLRINKLPAISFLPTMIAKGQWIAIDPKELATKKNMRLDSLVPISTNTFSDLEKSYREGKIKMFGLIKKIAQIADEEGVLVFKNKIKREKQDGQWLYRYDLSIAPAKAVSFSQRLLKELPEEEELFGGILTRQQSPVDFTSQESKEIIDYLNDHTFISLWVDDDGYVVKMEYVLKIAPPDSNARLKGKQVVLTFKLENSDINKEIKIAKPSGAKSIDEIFQETTVGDEHQRTMVMISMNKLRHSIEMYYQQHRTYGNKAFPLGPCAKTAGTLFADDSIYKELLEASNNDLTKATCGSQQKNYVVMVPLPDDPTYSYCIDSIDNSKEVIGKLSGYSCLDIK